MLLSSISAFKNSKFKTLCCDAVRKLNSSTLQPKLTAPRTTVKEDQNLLDIAPSWKPEIETTLRSAIFQDMKVYPNFISEEEEAAMITELEPQLKRMRYEFDHWDNAIHGFRETERSRWTECSENVLARVRATAFVAGLDAGEPLPGIHVLDLAPAGYIKPHVDAVRFCGNVIAGLCLISSAVMRLENSTNPELVLNALLERRSLYVMRGAARYSFSHAVLGGAESVFRASAVPRARRVAVICRSRPPPQHASDHTDPVLGP